MAKRTTFLVRADPLVLQAIRRWADDELRSMNGQIEYLLRRALKDAGRLGEQELPEKTDNGNDRQ